MDYTFWIAVIGCATGVISLGIEISRYLAERPRIQVRTYNELNNVVVIQGDAVKCYLQFQVLNTGSRHVLLQDVYLKRPGAGKSIRKNLVSVNRAYQHMPWEYCNDVPVSGPPETVHLPAGIPPGGVFECVLCFVDVKRECYDAGEQFLYPTLCAAFAPNTVRELKVQAIRTLAGDGFAYVDLDGNRWSFSGMELSRDFSSGEK